MTSHEILHADMLDIVFDGRNKSYGAYALRREYEGRMKLALGAAFGLSALAFLLMGFSGRKQTAPPLQTRDSIVLIDLVAPPQTPPPPPEAPPLPQPVKTVSHTDILIVPDHEATEIRENEEMIDARIGTENVDGVPPTGTEPPGAATAVAPEPQPEAPKVPEPAPEPPSPPMFPGGADAWIAFLQRHLTAPGELEPGARKTVLVEFRVDEEGHVTRFVVLQSAGSAYDNEVIRVLRKMPRWQPARQNGQPVSVTFKQPVTFVGEE
ncbi:MAG TPA: TonB family protein [Chitinophagaceae bacterium]|jgi:protein TonB|nr:TonB family protein [Chitinophagaceae bacterium]